MFGNFGRPFKPIWLDLSWIPAMISSEKRTPVLQMSFFFRKLCELELDTVALLFLFGNFGVQLMLNGWVGAP